MMKKTILSISCAALLTCGVTSVFAGPDLTVSGNVAMTTDYVFRGFTQSDGDAAIQGGFDVNHSSGFFAGIWASNIESDPAAPINYDGSSMELDTYLGWTGNVAGPEMTLKALRYNYPGTNTDANNTNEYSLYLSHDFGPAAVSGGLNYSDDYYGAGDTIYWDLGVDVPVGPVSLGLHYGSTDVDDDTLNADYQDYKVGVSGEAVGLGLDLSFYGTNDVNGGCIRRTCDDRVVFSMSKSF
jgi:uncharacterized protein (TIGR02001 family)